jgi:hypothetical protein
LNGREVLSEAPKPASRSTKLLLGILFQPDLPLPLTLKILFSRSNEDLNFNFSSDEPEVTEDECDKSDFVGEELIMKNEKFKIEVTLTFRAMQQSNNSLTMKCFLIYPNAEYFNF